MNPEDIARTDIPDLIAEVRRLESDLRHCRDLLAIIHCDGGHYTAENGIEKSCEKARAVLIETMEKIP